jgi:hypothetical protein
MDANSPLSKRLPSADNDTPDLFENGYWFRKAVL